MCWIGAMIVTFSDWNCLQKLNKINLFTRGSHRLHTDIIFITVQCIGNLIFDMEIWLFQ